MKKKLKPKKEGPTARSQHVWHKAQTVQSRSKTLYLASKYHRHRHSSCPLHTRKYPSPNIFAAGKLSNDRFSSQGSLTTIFHSIDPWKRHLQQCDNLLPSCTTRDTDWKRFAGEMLNKFCPCAHCKWTSNHAVIVTLTQMWVWNASAGPFIITTMRAV